jgi:putative hemolysin
MDVSGSAGDEGPLVSIILFICLVCIDMFFYGFGAAISQLNSKDTMRQAVEDKDKKSLRLSRILNHSSGYVNTLQIVVTFLHMVMGTVYFPLWRRSILSILTLITRWDAHVNGGIASVTAGILLLYIVLTFGILLPKKLAARNAQSFAYTWITPVYFVMLLLRPFNWLVSTSVHLVMSLMGVKNEADQGDVTEEIIQMVNEGHEQGLIQASEAEMITNIFDFADKEAQDIMTPRNHVVAVDGEAALEDAVRFIIQEKNSRFPVYGESMDHIIGILHLRDAMHAKERADVVGIPVKDIPDLLRKPYFVPRTKHIDELFQEMQRRKLQMAIVIDEYGQMDGLVAMEDILEEIVGNILDEYDEDVEYIEDKGNDEYVVEGMIPLQELEDRLDIEFEEEEFDTLNGFLISRMDKIPEADERFEVSAYGYHFKVLSVKNKRIDQVKITRIKPTDVDRS